MFLIKLYQLYGTMGILVGLFSVIVAISVHEFAHAWTAYRFGDDTPHLQGRVTLNPAAHLDPIGSVAFLILGFGWGRPVIYNPLRLSRRSDELLIALAGPASNILLAMLFNGVLLALGHLGGANLNTDLLTLPIYFNVLLAAFNMIPIPPLDGSSIVAYFWPDYRSLVGGQVGLILLLALIFIPINGTYLLDFVMSPLIHGFGQLSTLFGLLGHVPGF